MSQIEVRILQQDYVLTCPEGKEEALRAAVARVDADMERIRNTGKIRARERVGVLAAVNLAFENTELLAANEALSQSLLQAQDAVAPSSDAVDELAHEAIHTDNLEEAEEGLVELPVETQELSAIQEPAPSPEMLALMMELETLLAQRERELLQAKALIERLEAALEVEDRLL